MCRVGDVRRRRRGGAGSRAAVERTDPVAVVALEARGGLRAVASTQLGGCGRRELPAANWAGRMVRTRVACGVARARARHWRAAVV